MWSALMPFKSAGEDGGWVGLLKEEYPSALWLNHEFPPQIKEK